MILANAYVYDATVFGRKNAMNCQRNSDPLVFDAAVVVSVKGKPLRSFERILLDVQARSRCHQDVQTLF